MYQALLAATNINMEPMYFLSTTPFLPYVATAAGCYHGGPFLSMAADEQQDTPSLPDHLRCGYTSKRCENPRTVKKSGGMHRFCAYHRERANKNQWRVDNRRRIQKQRRGSHMSPTKSSPSSTSSDCDSPRSTTSSRILESSLLDDSEVSEFALSFGDQEHAANMKHATMDDWDGAGSPYELSGQDAEILHAMLFNDEDNLYPSTVPAATSHLPLDQEDSVFGLAFASSTCDYFKYSPTTTMLYDQAVDHAAARRDTYGRL